LAVPPAIAHLLTEEPMDDAVDVAAEVGAERHDLAVDAGLNLASEERLAVVLPCNLIVDSADGLAGLQAGGIESESAQQHQAPGGRGPFWKERALPRGRQGPPPTDRLSRSQPGRNALVPVAILPLESQQRRAPTLCGDLCPLGRYLYAGHVHR